jgi:hypothetical protein
VAHLEIGLVADMKRTDGDGYRLIKLSRVLIKLINIVLHSVLLSIIDETSLSISQTIQSRQLL